MVGPALLPFFVLQANYTYAAVAGITPAATALSRVAQPVFGHLSDTYGMRWMSLVGLLAAGVGVAANGLVSNSYPVVWIVIVISGVGVAAYHPAATMEARDHDGVQPVFIIMAVLVAAGFALSFVLKERGAPTHHVLADAEGADDNEEVLA